jgi:hypothetical protein
MILSQGFTIRQTVVVATIWKNNFVEKLVISIYGEASLCLFVNLLFVGGYFFSNLGHWVMFVSRLMQVPKY